MNEDTKNKMAAILAAAQAKAGNKTVPTFTPTPKAAPKQDIKPIEASKPVFKPEVKDIFPELSKMTFADLVNDNPIPEPKKTALKLVDYSDKAFAVVGETKPIKDQLRKLGGRFNYYLTCGAGWVFPKTKAYTVRKALNLI